MKLQNRVIDASEHGSLGRFINHACKANAEFRKIAVNGITRVGVYAKTNIGIMDEITCEYLHSCPQNDENSYKCKCTSGCNNWLQDIC